LKILQIKKSAEFQNIGKKGQKFFSKTILLISHATPQNYLQNLIEDKKAKDFCRVGYTVSKTVGNAVIRNRAKRRLREVFRAASSNYCKNHHDYVLIARREIAGADFGKISDDLKFCLKRIHLQNGRSRN
jgi:ribonuclease P protein component